MRAVEIELCPISATPPEGVPVQRVNRGLTPPAFAQSLRGYVRVAIFFEEPWSLTPHPAGLPPKRPDFR